MSYCPTCGAYMVFPEHHKCPPEWEARDPDYSGETDWETVRAHDAESAAADFAEACDNSCGEGPHERAVIVRAKGSDETHRFRITFDYSVDYYAHKDTTA